MIYIDGIACDDVPPAAQMENAKRALSEYAKKITDRRSVREACERAGRSAESILLVLDDIERLERLSVIERARIQWLSNRIPAGDRQ